MSEIVVETTPTETVIEIEGGPVLTTTVEQELQTVIEVPSDPVVIDLNSGARGEPGSAIHTGAAYPASMIGQDGDLYVVTDGSVQAGFVFLKENGVWEQQGSIRGPAGGIDVINGYTGPIVDLVKGDVGLGNVDDTRDIDKPISTATQAALDTTVKLTGNQTVAGEKAFTSPLIMKGQSVLVDMPNSAGGWARGMSFRSNVGGTILGGIGLLGSAETPTHIYIGAGEDPYNAGTGLKISMTGNATFSHAVTAASFSGNGAALTSLNGSNVSSGTVADARLSTNVVLANSTQTISGQKTFSAADTFINRWRATNGSISSLTDWNVGPNAGDAVISRRHTHSGSVNQYHIVDMMVRRAAPSDWTTAVLYQGVGVDTSFLDSPINGANPLRVWIKRDPQNQVIAFGSGTTQYVEFASTGITGNGAGITNLSGSNVSSGTVDDARLSANIAKLGSSQTFTGDKTFTGAVIVPTPTASNHAATKGYIDSIVDAAPGTLDTLNELAAALGDDPNFATTMTNQLALKAPLNSPAFTGTVTGITKEMVGLGNINNVAQVEIAGAQTITGAKTFSAGLTVSAGSTNVINLSIKPEADHGYISFFSRDAAPSTRTAYVGVGAPGGVDFYVTNEMALGKIRLDSAGGVFVTNGLTVSSGAISGNGSGLTSLNASNLTTGEVGNSRLPSRLREQGQPSVTDWNDAIQSGWYHGSNAANAPSTGWFMGMVTTHDQQAGNRYVTQQVWNFTDAGDDSQAWERRSTGASVWSPWRRVRRYQTELDARYRKMDWVGTGGIYTYRDLVAQSFAGTGLPRYMRINTNVPLTSGIMLKIHIKAHIYTKGVVDGWLTTYMYNNAGGTIHVPRWVNNGNYVLDDFKVAKDANNNLVIILDSSGWTYTRVSVEEVEAANGNYSTGSYFSGWTVTNTADLTGLTETSMSSEMESAEVINAAVVRVVHGATASTARPKHATSVEWVGSVVPTNMATNDTWVNTSTNGNTSDNRPAGSVMASASAKPTAPAGWYWMEGQEILISGDTALYNELTNNGATFPYGGNTNGSGAAGSTHFRLPNSKGKVIAHADGTTEFASVGTSFGTKTVTLTAAQSGVPAHNHGVSDPGHYHSGSTSTAITYGINRVMSAAGSGVAGNHGVGYAGGIVADLADGSQSLWSAHIHTFDTNVVGTGVTTVNNTTQNASQSHNNIQPTLTLRYMIKR